MKRVHLLTLMASLLLLTTVILILRPVPTPAESACEVTTGTVWNIYETGVKDVTFQLKGDHRRYYINRGLEQGLDLQQLRAELIGQEVELKYPSYWTPLDPKGRIRHLAKVSHGDRVIFSELAP